MKRELVAGIALILLCTAVTLNIIYIRTVTNSLADFVLSSQHAYENGNADEAESELRNALEIWNNFGNYTYVALRHTEIDTVTDAFYELLSGIIDQDDQVFGNYEHVLAGLSRINDMETPSLGSVF